MSSDHEVKSRDRDAEIRREQLEDAKIPFWKKRRYHVIVMIFFGLFNLINLRMNLSVTIVAMTQKVNETLSDGTTIEKQDFDWDSKTQGLILSSFFYGYIATQLLGGFLSAKFGGHLVFGIGLGVTSVLALLIPMAAKTHLGLFLAARILQGIFEGGTFPSIIAIWGEWAPIYERSFMANIAYTGNYLGIIGAMLLSGIVTVALGWEYVFYIFGALGCFCYICWIIIVKADPNTDPFITDAEKNYILSSLGDRTKDKNIKHPWKDILTSTAVWAVAIGNFTSMWGTLTLQTQLPTFLSDTLDYNLDVTGIIAAAPYMVIICLLFVSGFLADWFHVKGYLRTGQVRRYFNCFAFIMQMIFLLLITFTTSPVVIISSLCFAVGFGAFSWSGYAINALDLAPSHASVIKGVASTVGTLAGIISPIAAGNIVMDKSREQWRIVFYIAAGVYLAGAVFCWIFVRGNIQSWAKIDLDRLAAKKAESENERNTRNL
ncbi:vesicular glutamate transporter 1-like [Phlebotomus papatasi]|uniref:vesicular glutamate transporter 1-like n=1 Tax=Phlebotomus papatasi TaxID=29031 RepID=UPI0024840A31|nr:vesicular glutamate transporter 1-like [Phlebotomus papatasi]